VRFKHGSSRFGKAGVVMSMRRAIAVATETLMAVLLLV
jgi:hypothetical protein